MSRRAFYGSIHKPHYEIECWPCSLGGNGRISPIGNTRHATRDHSGAAKPRVMSHSRRCSIRPSNVIKAHWLPLSLSFLCVFVSLSLSLTTGAPIIGPGCGTGIDGINYKSKLSHPHCWPHRGNCVASVSERIHSAIAVPGMASLLY